MHKSFYLLTAILSMLFAIDAVAKENTKPAVAAIDAYFESIDTFSASFTQYSEDEKREGKVFLKKPNLVRIEYPKPDNEVIVMDDKLAMYYNKDLNQKNYANPEGVGLDFLINPDFKIAKNAYIIKAIDSKSRYVLQFKSKKDAPQSFVITLNKSPLTLYSMDVLDEDGGKVTMVFKNIKLNIDLADKLFDF